MNRTRLYVASGRGRTSDAGRRASHGLVRSHTTRVLHLLLLLVVVHQLVGSEFMQRPFPGDPPAGLYALHQYLGLAGLAVVALFWMWAMARRGETRLWRLLPWFSVAGLRAVWADVSAQLRRLAGGRAPDDEDGALASAVHGLGLLAVTMMAVTGGVVFFVAGTPVAHAALSAHKFVANLVWAYLFGHAGLAVLHSLLGSDIFSRMFWVRPRRPAGGAYRRRQATLAKNPSPPDRSRAT